jgi:hypothetical protein
MVTVGASGALNLTLWVIADQRFESRNYATRRILEQELVWDWNIPGSNYATLFDRAIDAAGGRAWIAEYASPIGWLYFSVADDLAIASVDLKHPYVTRLRTRMLVDHLGEDLELQPASEVGHVSNFLQVPDSNQINLPDRQCPDWDSDGIPDDRDPDRNFWGDRDGAGCTTSGRGAPAAPIVLALITGVAILAVRSRRRRQ